MKEAKTKKDYFDSVWFSSLQAKIAIASFCCGVAIGSVCLFAIDPKGEISNSAISIVSELLVLAGALLGVQANFDHKQRKFANEIAEQLARKQDKPEQE